MPIGRSILAGLAFTAAASAATVSPLHHTAYAPDLAVNGRGEMALLWVDRAPDAASVAGRDDRLSYVDLYVAISGDGGASWAGPTKVNHTSGVVRALQTNRPRIVGAASGVWHVSYTANEIHADFSETMLTTHYTRSVDGVSFEPPRRLSPIFTEKPDAGIHIHNDHVGAAAFGTLAVTPLGGAHVLWIDSRHMTPGSDVRALYVASSSNDGATFSPPRKLIDTGVCPCCQMTAVSDDTSALYVGLRDVHSDGARQAAIVKLSADGSLVPPVDTGGARWKIDGCPMKPTVVGVAGRSVFTAVHNGAAQPPGVYFSSSSDAGATYSTAQAVHPEATVSDAPAVAIGGATVLVAWHAKVGDSRRVFTRRYDLSGAPVGGPAVLPEAGEGAQNPVIAVRADGDFQIAWQQSNRIMTSILPAAPTN